MRCYEPQIILEVVSSCSTLSRLILCNYSALRGIVSGSLGHVGAVGALTEWRTWDTPLTKRQLLVGYDDANISPPKKNTNQITTCHQPFTSRFTPAKGLNVIHLNDKNGAILWLLGRELRRIYVRNRISWHSFKHFLLAKQTYVRKQTYHDIPSGFY